MNSKHLVTFLLNATWQIPFIAALAALASRVLKNGPARYRHLIWVAALLASAIVPTYSALQRTVTASMPVNVPVAITWPETPGEVATSARVTSVEMQRFYELVSFAMFAALRQRRDEAKLVDSDYCLRAPQMRYFTRAPMQKQMYKVHRPHVEAGYIAKLRYRQITDQEGQADWEIYYTPGPRARAQFAYFKNRQKNEVIEATQADTKALEAPREVSVHLARTAETQELTNRGITPERSEKLLREFRGGGVRSSPTFLSGATSLLAMRAAKFVIRQASMCT